MDIVKIVGIGLLGATLAITVKKQAPEIALQVSLAVSALIALLLLEDLACVISAVKDFTQQYAQVYQAVTLILKVVGIAYISEFTAQMLKDAGQGAIGSKVELAGKVIILGFTLPLLSQFAEAVMGLL